MLVRIGCVVEDHGEVAAVPILIRRIASELDPALLIEVPRPVRVSKSKLLKPSELERATDLAACNVGGLGGIFVLLDSDDDCPATLGPDLLARVKAAHADLPSAVVLAKKEFEAWFLASAESLRGCRGLPGDLHAPPEPEGIAGAKEWLDARTSYAPTVDQAALTSQFDFTLARRAPSFDKCYRAIVDLLTVLRHQGL